MNKKDKFGYWFSGLVDGEGCFNIAIRKVPHSNFALQIHPRFIITLNEKEYPTLLYIQKNLKNFFGIKIRKPIINIYKKKKENKISKRAILQCETTACRQLIDFFKKYSLKIKKKDFEIWSKIINYMNKRKWKHRTKEDLLTIAKLNDKLNRGTKRTKWTYIKMKKYLESFPNADIKIGNRYTDEFLLNEIKRVYNIVKRPFGAWTFDKFTQNKSSSVKRHFGTMRNALAQAQIKEKRKK